jgi:hypothetical protein
MPIDGIQRPLRKLARKRPSVPAIGGKYYLTFPPDLAQQSVICDMYDRLGVRFSIRQAQVGDDVAILGVELMGSAERLRVAERYLASRGVRVQPVALVRAE